MPDQNNPYPQYTSPPTPQAIPQTNNPSNTPWKKIIMWTVIIVVILAIIFVAYILLSGKLFSKPIPNGAEIICSEDTYNCDDFQLQVDAQRAFDECNETTGDIHRLDADGNGVACESLG